MNKKLLYGMLSGVFAVGMLAACGGDMEGEDPLGEDPAGEDPAGEVEDTEDDL
ncbi:MULTISPECIES: hypothetical protein [Geomicrobium]|uniref:Uncharacterized protein n=1 Tax=Geomicrobium sediminis TaxID=1347788 RepID=A0ABS2PHW4_9BACL|nr:MULTISPECIES: hypothetical protein [Geomicrobium]MBM7635030.1 hypothetical protein [Geomicrobium sediminis]GAJ99536.1 hypothetical protein JCM19055_2541 [Geomicrobium sp. JCM 19055]GAK09777.1 hypothetical protein JCM19038_3633 [Geomicrobium sp. JCM 19038]